MGRPVDQAIIQSEGKENRVKRAPPLSAAREREYNRWCMWGRSMSIHIVRRFTLTIRKKGWSEGRSSGQTDLDALHDSNNRLAGHEPSPSHSRSIGSNEASLAHVKYFHKLKRDSLDPAGTTAEEVNVE